jgi:hypothetical protein
MRLGNCGGSITVAEQELCRVEQQETEDAAPA